ncbi:MAG: NAD(P)-dependent oxidoreductase [Pseudonocardiales bacterium]|nr:NAD(P)-dependent oxidoreductase [Pseudonocardiales bacterium]
MGKAMAGRLVEAGHDVLVWNRSPDPVAELVARGATATASVREALETGLVFSMLSDDTAVLDVFDDATLSAAPAGALHVNMATVGVESASALDRRHDAAGVGYLAAPVLGRSTVAAQGALSILAAGDTAALERAAPYFDLMGRRTWNFGADPGNANVVKIGVNYLIIHALQAMAESVALLEGRGVDPAKFVELLGDSLFPGPVYSGYGSAIVEQRYLPAGFTTALGRKDLRLATEVADSAGTALPTAAVLRDVFDEALSAGQADLDWASIAEVTRRRSSR